MNVIKLLVCMFFINNVGLLGSQMSVSMAIQERDIENRFVDLAERVQACLPDTLLSDDHKNVNKMLVNLLLQAENNLDQSITSQNLGNQLGYCKVVSNILMSNYAITDGLEVYFDNVRKTVSFRALLFTNIEMDENI